MTNSRQRAPFVNSFLALLAGFMIAAGITPYSRLPDNVSFFERVVFKGIANELAESGFRAESEKERKEAMVRKFEETIARFRWGKYGRPDWEKETVAPTLQPTP